VEIAMGRNARSSALKRDRERRKAEKAAKKRERREQRKSEAAFPDAVSLTSEEGSTGEGTVVADAADLGTLP
jgi:hypothetical protein